MSKWKQTDNLVTTLQKVKTETNTNKTYRTAARSGGTWHPSIAQLCSIHRSRQGSTLTTTNVLQHRVLGRVGAILSVVVIIDSRHVTIGLPQRVQLPHHQLVVLNENVGEFGH